ncbi:MAG: peptidase dimerization domain-containing protein, partial [Anaerolineales bacterium]|nr:peptidase dimerization domain-containing protein [Anaerolineales bacterium]
VSAVLELSYVTQTLFGLTDFDSGVTVNVGVIKGGVQPNVITPLVEAWVDARLPTTADAARIDAAIKNLKPTLAGAKLEITGGINRPPMEYTAGNAALWAQAQAVGEALGLALDHATVGGASDGNTTSLFTPTLDGLGPVGAGAHAPHEMLWTRPWLERCGLLTMLLLKPAN